MPNFFTVTLQALVPPREQNSKAEQYLAEYGMIFGQASRTSFSLRNRVGKTDQTATQLEKASTKQLETRFNISNTEAKNAYTKGLAVYDSQAALVDIYIDDNYEKITGIAKSIKKLEKKLKNALALGHALQVRRLKQQIHFKNQKINQLEAKINRFKLSRESGKFSVTFGSKRLFRRQYQLERNNYTSHQEWLEDWRQKRSARSYFIGAKNYQSGNQLVRYNPGEKTLTVTVTPALREKYGEFVVLNGVQFLRGYEWLLAALEPTVHKSSRNGKNGKKLATSRNGSKLPITYEIVSKASQLYVNATINVEAPLRDSSFENGALGIDFNPTSVDWSLIDRYGNLRLHGSIKTNIQDKRSNQTKDIIGKTVAAVVRIATNYKVPIVIEDLEFAKKKASMKEKGKKYARMLSNMAYSQFIQMMESRPQKSGIELFKVDAAYTSVIGVTKYMAMYGLNSGCAAALVIARRGQGRTEKLPKSLATYLKKPEDLFKSAAWRTVARKVNLVGGFNRHKFYNPGDKKVKSNALLYGKLRQTPTSKKLGHTVQVLSTPHIAKTSALQVSLALICVSKAV